MHTMPLHQQNLLLHVLSEFLFAIGQAIPELGANEILEIIRKDPQAPSKTDEWGRSVYNILRRTQQRSNRNSQFIVFEKSEMEEADSTFSSPSITSVIWHSCRGSTPNYRGYTCGLWMLFHALLSNSPAGAATRSLKALHDYVINFFMCLECRIHFSQFQFQASSFKSDLDAVMWLFRAHNSVNQRLALKTQESQTSSSSDPFVPKVQFPSPDLCYGGCNSKSSDKVLYQFLKNHYHWGKIRKSGVCSSEEGEDQSAKNKNSAKLNEHHSNDDTTATALLIVIRPETALFSISILLVLTVVIWVVVGKRLMIMKPNNHSNKVFHPRKE
jgi:hypothetical protein